MPNWQDIHPAKRFDSMILAEEIGSFNQIASHNTRDILLTIDALNATREDDVLIENRYEMPWNVTEREPPGFTELIFNLFSHNFYIGEIIGSIFQPTETPNTEWLYAYSRNETLLNMSTEQLREEKDLKLYYLQVDSSQRCMPVGGPISYDTFMVYTFVSLIGYGQNAGHLKSYLRSQD